MKKFTNSNECVDKNRRHGGQADQQPTSLAELRRPARCDASFDKSRTASEIHNLRRLRIIVSESTLSVVGGSCEDRHGVLETLCTRWSRTPWQ